MTLTKKEDRILKISQFMEAMKPFGVKTEEVETFCKWKEITTGKLQIKLGVYRNTEKDGTIWYLVTDSLNRIASPRILDLNEIRGWMKEHGYLPEKDWYMANGMTEETWNEWNNG